MRTRSGRAAARGRAEAPGEHASTGRHTAGRTVGGRWLVLGKDGRLTAYARTGDGLLRWTELRPGGPQWSAPEFFPVDGLTHLTVVQGADAYVHFLGRREVRRADGSPAVDIVHAIQYQTGRPVTEWRSLGNAHQDRERAARFGAPAGAVSGSGRVHVFARNAGGGVMLRREDASGKWEGWQDLKGSQVKDGMAAVVHDSGRVELLAVGEGVVMRWQQESPDGAFRREPNVSLRVAPGTVAALPTGPERATYYWAEPDRGGLVAHRPGRSAIPLGGAPDGEPVGALRADPAGYDCTVLAHRDQDWQVLFAVCGTENEQAGVRWSPTGERALGAPALALDGRGRVVLALIGPDGRLRVARQTEAADLSLGPWTRA